jgi:ribonucleotide reductase beta subunit family protein with ferritin-like domain
METEPILSEESNRYVLQPIIWKEVWELYKKHQKAFWTAEEIDFPADKSDWEKLNQDEQKLISNVLSFFAGSDGIIFENLSINFIDEIKIPEIRAYYGWQAAMETIHSETYALMIDTYISDHEEKLKIFNGIKELSGVKKKADWTKMYLNKEIPFSQRLVAFTIVEGIFFAGSFCVIFWLKYVKGLMTKALGKSNELIARDESLHTDFGVLMYSYIKNRLPESTMFSMMCAAVDVEKEFICDSFSCNLIGINPDSMKKYIEFQADRLLQKFGYKKIYNAECPFSFMDTMSLDGKTNFFEQRVTDYNRPEQNDDKSLEYLENF